MGGIYHSETVADDVKLHKLQTTAVEIFASSNALYPGVFP
jgi:hypothetical protein